MEEWRTRKRFILYSLTRTMEGWCFGPWFFVMGCMAGKKNSWWLGKPEVHPPHTVTWSTRADWASGRDSIEMSPQFLTHPGSLELKVVVWCCFARVPSLQNREQNRYLGINCLNPRYKLNLPLRLQIDFPPSNSICISFLDCRITSDKDAGMMSVDMAE